MWRQFFGLAALGIVGAVTMPIVSANVGHSDLVVPAPAAVKPAVKPPIKPGLEHHHSGTAIAIPKGQAIPTIKLVVTPDAMKGWNMNIQTENFAFAPERASQSSKTTEGHAHFFLNGKKVARIYGPWAHIPSLPKGKNELKVTLNTNMHEDLTQEGKVIEATTTIEVP